MSAALSPVLGAGYRHYPYRADRPSAARTGGPVSPTEFVLMPCPACTVLDCEECVGIVEDQDGLKVRCPCAEAGHWEDDEDQADQEWYDFGPDPY